MREDMHFTVCKGTGSADHIGILGTGAALPEMVLSNEDLKRYMDTSDEWIRSRTGISERHIAVRDTTVTLAVRAAKQALKQAGCSGEDIDLIIVSSVSPDYRFPTASCLVQRAIGANGAMAFDISAACSGFVYGYTIAYKFLKSGGYRRALVVGSETLSRITDWSDRSTAVLFGDGAGAAVLGYKEGSGLLAEELGADGGSSEMLVCSDLNGKDAFFQPKMHIEEMEEDDPRRFLAPFEEKASPYMTMAGREVYKFATTFVPASIRRVMEKAGLEKEAVDWYVLHQANSRIIESAANRLGEEIRKFPMSIAENANTSSSSIPILLNRMVTEGTLKDGQTVVLSGFGAGMTWGSVALVW